MATTVLDEVKGIFAATHQRLLAAVDDLTDEQLAWRPTPTSHTIGFELWHVARANDRFSTLLPTLLPALRVRVDVTEQIWMAEGMAAAWGLEASRLGGGQSGSGMSDEDAAALRLPGKDVLVAYATRTFAAVERVVHAITETEAVTVIPASGWPGDQRLVWYVLFYFGHDDWVLGYISALRRAQGLKRVEA